MAVNKADEDVSQVGFGLDDGELAAFDQRGEDRPVFTGVAPRLRTYWLIARR
jgi:hypothetical protein